MSAIENIKQLYRVFVCFFRLVLRSLQGSMFPSEVTKTMYLHKNCSSSVASTVSVTWSRDSSNESSVDLGVNGEARNHVPGEPHSEHNTLSTNELNIHTVNCEYTIF